MESLLEQVKLLEESNNKLSNENSTLKATIARLSEELITRDTNAAAKAGELRELSHALSLSKGNQEAQEKSVQALRDEMEAKAKAAADHAAEIARLKEELATAKREFVDNVKGLGEALKKLQPKGGAGQEEEMAA